MSLINARVAECSPFVEDFCGSESADLKQMMYIAPAHVIKITACGEN